MPQINTTLTGHSSKSGKTKKGRQWTLHVFTSEEGIEYQTFESGLGNKAFGLLNQPVTITFEVEQRDDFANNVISSVDAASGTVSAVQAAQQGSPPPASVQTQSAPVAPTNTEQYQRRKHPNEELQIHRQSAMDRAIAYYAATGEPFTTDDVYALADKFVEYFVNGREPAEVVPIAAGAAQADVGF